VIHVVDCLPDEGAYGVVWSTVNAEICRNPVHFYSVDATLITVHNVDIWLD